MGKSEFFAVGSFMSWLLGAVAGLGFGDELGVFDFFGGILEVVAGEIGDEAGGDGVEVFEFAFPED